MCVRGSRGGEDGGKQRSAGRRACELDGRHSDELNGVCAVILSVCACRACACAPRARPEPRAAAALVWRLERWILVVLRDDRCAMSVCRCGAFRAARAVARGLPRWVAAPAVPEVPSARRLDALKWNRERHNDQRERTPCQNMITGAYTLNMWFMLSFSLSRSLRVPRHYDTYPVAGMGRLRFHGGGGIAGVLFGIGGGGMAGTSRGRRGMCRCWMTRGFGRVRGNGGELGSNALAAAALAAAAARLAADDAASSSEMLCCLAMVARAYRGGSSGLVARARCEEPDTCRGGLVNDSSCVSVSRPWNRMGAITSCNLLSSCNLYETDSPRRDATRSAACVWSLYSPLRFCDPRRRGLAVCSRRTSSAPCVNDEQRGYLPNDRRNCRLLRDGGRDC